MEQECVQRLCGITFTFSVHCATLRPWPRSLHSSSPSAKISPCLPLSPHLFLFCLLELFTTPHSSVSASLDTVSKGNMGYLAPDFYFVHLIWTQLFHLWIIASIKACLPSAYKILSNKCSLLTSNNTYVWTKRYEADSEFWNVFRIWEEMRV